MVHKQQSKLNDMSIFFTRNHSFPNIVSFGMVNIININKREKVKNVGDFKKLNDFLNKLQENHIFYQLSKIRNESIMVEVAVPGQRWEIEFMEDGTVEIEKFISDGQYYDGQELEVLFKAFSS